MVKHGALFFGDVDRIICSKRDQSHGLGVTYELAQPHDTWYGLPPW